MQDAWAAYYRSIGAQGAAPAASASAPSAAPGYTEEQRVAAWAAYYARQPQAAGCAPRHPQQAYANAHAPPRACASAYSGYGYGGGSGAGTHAYGGGHMPRPGTLPGQPVLPAAAASAYGGGGVPAAAPVHSASDAVAALRASARALVQPSLASGGAVQSIAPGVALPNLHAAAAAGNAALSFSLAGRPPGPQPCVAQRPATATAPAAPGSGPPRAPTAPSKAALATPCSHPSPHAAFCAAGSSSGDQWPPELRAWVERAFALCSTDTDRSNVQRNLKARISQATQSRTLWSNNWRSEPLPSKHNLDRYLPDPMPAHGARYMLQDLAPARRGDGAHCAGPRDGRDTDRTRTGSSPRHDRRWGEARGEGGEHDGGPSRRVPKRKRAKGLAFDQAGGRAGGGRANPEEDARRAKRANRFEAHFEPSGGTLEERMGRTSGHGAGRWHGGVDDDGELDFTVAGTCEVLEKKYLRLTSEPDPATVRPELVLRQAVEMIVAKRQSWELLGDDGDAGRAHYIYLWEQMKSIRQDLTVQRIRNDFTVQVYEMHARICLEYSDMTEFNQCTAQLGQLYLRRGEPGVHSPLPDRSHDPSSPRYEEELGEREVQREFIAYNLLYNVGKQADTNVADIMLDLTADDRASEYIAHALQVREATALRNYSKFFKLYAGAPGHAQYVMDTFVERERLSGLRIFCKAYQAIDVSFVAQQLGFDDDDDDDDDDVVDEPQPATQGGASKADANCAWWLEDHGAALAVDRATLDCKLSRPSLVEHSISAKRLEDEKERRRKAEIVPISFGNGES